MEGLIKISNSIAIKTFPKSTENILGESGTRKLVYGIMWDLCILQTSENDFLRVSSTVRRYAGIYLDGIATKIKTKHLTRILEHAMLSDKDFRILVMMFDE